MKHIYLYSFLLIGLLLFTTPASAQVSTDFTKETPIEGLSIYPNPATAGDKVYIITRARQNKTVEIYNVLGKNLLVSKMTGNELNISSLDPGIYILKIKEGSRSATRKLVIQ